MKRIESSSLKTILMSKRAHMYYLEHCRVLLNGGRVEYLTSEGNRQDYWNIPIANTTTILLGTGTSITQAAARELSRAGVSIGFCGTDGTPLYSASECDPVIWITPQNEYRPVGYVQKWLSFWYDDDKRLSAAKMLQKIRSAGLKKNWSSGRVADFNPDLEVLNALCADMERFIDTASSINELLLEEARFTKKLYSLAASASGYGVFRRNREDEAKDIANRFLDQGNYLAYGLGAAATWALGLPHAFALMHGKTRRGGLVFDAADLIKDSLVLPCAFASAMNGSSEKEFRKKCTDLFTETEALDFIITALKEISNSM